MRAGLGLENRGRELAHFWSDHLSRSRAAQARWSTTCSGDVLTVLGAGALRDFNSNALAPRFKRFRLVDANPLVTNVWGRLNKPVEPVVTDISCCIHTWCQAIQQYQGTWEQTMGCLRELGASAVPAYAPPTDALLSLNILSQLEVAWQEMAEPILRKRFGAGVVRQRQQDWLNAIRPGSKTLVEQHLAALESSGASSVLLITDVEYLDYTGREYSSKQAEPPPVTWTQAGWKAEEGIRFEVTPALEGVELNGATLARWMPSLQLEWMDQWLWHLAPNGTESASYGKLHRVAAFALRRLL